MSLVKMSQKQGKRPSTRGLGVGKKKLSMNNSNVSTPIPTFNTNLNRKLILEQQYQLDTEYRLAIGIDPLANFSVVIRMITFGHLSKIQLDVNEFSELLNTHNFIQDNSTDAETTTPSTITAIPVSACINIEGTKKVKIEKNNEKLYLDLCVMQQLFKMSSIFYYYINMLKSINFFQFFKDAVSWAFNTQINMDISTLMDQMTNLNGGIDFLGIKEMIIFYPEFIYDGLINVVTTNIVENYNLQ